MAIRDPGNGAELETPSEVLGILRLESDVALFGPEVDGWAAWSILRPHVISRLANLPLVGKSRSGTFHRAVQAAGDLLRVLRVGPVEAVIKTYASGLVEREGDRYRDVWFDDVLPSLGEVCKVMAVNNPVFGARGARALHPHRLTNELFDGMLPGAVARITRPRAVTVAARALHQRARTEPELSDLSEQFIAHVLSAFSWARRSWRALLRRALPRVVLVADPYEYSLIAAAREEGIPVVELQHGLNDPAHHAAYAWGDGARVARYRLPLPDRLFLYGEHWRQRLASTGFWGRELITIGSARVDRYRITRQPRPGDVCRVVFTGQGLDVPEVASFLRAWLRSLPRSKAVELVLKLHPAYEADPAAYLGALGDDSRVRVLLGSEEPSTLALIAESHLHLSISSTCHYEALALGTPTGVLPLSTHEIMLPLVRAGHARLVRTPTELVELVDGGALRPLPPNVGERYFASGAVDRLRDELARLMVRRPFGSDSVEP